MGEIRAEFAVNFEVGPGDTLPITIYPDDFEKSTSGARPTIIPPTNPSSKHLMQPAPMVRPTLVLPGGKDANNLPNTPQRRRV